MQSVKDCTLCKPHFDFANKVSDAIYLAIQDGAIEINGRDFLIDDNYTLQL